MYRSKLKLLLICCCLLLAGDLLAQDASYFVYIQHEKQQPFYVKMNGKVISSSVRGYVILPKMPQGKVPVTIGFLKDEASEQAFSLRITGQRDYGYLLKSNPDNEYALYDLQTFATLKSGGLAPAPAGEQPVQEMADVAVTRISDSGASAETKAMMDSVQHDVQAVLAKQADTQPAVAVKKNGFAEALDKVVKDDRPDDMPLEAAKPKPVVAPPPPPEEVVVTETPSRKKNKRKQREELSEEEKSILSSVMEDEKQAAAEEALKETPDEAVAVVEEPAPEPKKEKKKKKRDGEPDFIDFTATGGPAPSGGGSAEAAPEMSAKEKRQQRRAEKATEEDAIVTVSEGEDVTPKESKRQQRKADREAAERAAYERDSIANAEYGVIPVEDGTSKAEKKAAEKKKDELKMINSDCPNTLEVDAFRKLLRTMNGKKNDEDMVDAFRRGTRSVCVSTEQVRALAQLIVTDENRYQLLDAAYPRTYDSQNFSNLTDLLKDDYYKRRFKAMMDK